MKIPFVTDAGDRSAQGLVPFDLQNLYPATDTAQLSAFARQGPALVQPAGATTWKDQGASVTRGLFQFPGAGGGSLFSVHGTNLDKIASDGTVTNVGTVTGTDRVIFDMIYQQVLVCANGAVWYTNSGGTTLTQIVDADLGTISAIAAMDGRLIAARDAADTFCWSDVLAPGTIGTLSFATAEAYGDRLIRPVVYQRNLFLLGERTAEIWGSTPDSSQPFARIGNAVEPYGCAARHSVAQHGPLIFFVAVAAQDNAPGVVMLSPSLAKISTPAIERLLRSLSTTDLAAITGFVYRQNGAILYHINLPGVGTYVYHVESNTWFRRRKGTDTVWHSACYADAYGKHLVGSSSADGLIYELDDTVSTDAGDSLIRVAHCYLPAERPTPVETLFVDAGVRGASGTPSASVAFSHDDGENFVTARTVNLSKAGARAPLSTSWGSIRRPGALVKTTISGDYRVALYNLLVNEAAT